jgi:hypothetical protein
MSSAPASETAPALAAVSASNPVAPLDIAARATRNDRRYC